MYMESSDKFKEASENLKNVFVEAAREDIERMSPRELTLMQALVKYMTASETIIEEQEKMLNTIDYKLYQLLKKLETK